MATAPSPSAADKARKDAIVRWSILILGFIICVAMAYGSGMRRQKKVLDGYYEQVKKSNQAWRLAEINARGHSAQVQQWEARRQLTLALEELDKRNFGTAQERVAEAVVRLKTAQEANAANTADLAELIGQLEATQFTAGADVSVEREKVLTLARAMDAGLNMVVPKPDALSPITAKDPTLNDVPGTPGNDVTRTQ